MKGLLLFTGTNSLMYCACTSIIRCFYVRSSLQENVQRVLKRNSFTMSFLVLGVFYNIFLLSVFIYEQKDRTGIDRLSLVMYRACIDPWAEWSTPLSQAYPVTSNDVPYVWHEHCQSVMQLLPFLVLGRTEKEQQRLD